MLKISGWWDFWLIIFIFHILLNNNFFKKIDKHSLIDLKQTNK